MPIYLLVGIPVVVVILMWAILNLPDEEEEEETEKPQKKTSKKSSKKSKSKKS